MITEDNYPLGYKNVFMMVLNNDFMIFVDRFVNDCEE